MRKLYLYQILILCLGRTGHWLRFGGRLRRGRNPGSYEVLMILSTDGCLAGLKDKIVKFQDINIAYGKFPTGTSERHHSPAIHMFQILSIIARIQNPRLPSICSIKLPEYLKHLSN
jgi:hypothetical protein